MRNKIKLYITEQNIKQISNLTKQIMCKHQWKKNGFGYKCFKCNWYTGLDENLNIMIKKLYTSK